MIVDALRAYLADEGQEVLDIQAGIEEAERGEAIPFEQVIAELEKRIVAAKVRHLRRPGPRFSVEEMFRGRPPGEWRKEYAGAVDWGPDVGREVVAE